ncbi:META domain-containing protein [Streptomyces filamentosus]|uniref:Lipoprotein n=1 Tax=Streptomyces filamentosus TaxID=67294 RepID=A0A919EL34_STRFL|nr:META domain-containing protein [Streptomyces filamentosus]KAA6218691.1 META domain-containing protein [Streptomyces filamentosus]GHF92696.1 lipoprotein [Streptomyces filamentosus]
MPKPRSTLAAAALLLAALTACGRGGGSGGAGDPDLPLAGTHWTVTAVTVDGSRSKAPGGAAVEFTRDGRTRGGTGCNHFGGTAAVAGTTVTVSPDEVTEMGCPEDRRRFETAFLAAFAGPLTGTLEDGALTLASADGGRKVELAAEPSAPLRGTSWKIDGLVSEDAAASLPEGGGDKARFVVGADGRITGNLGCNGFSAAAKVDEEAGTLTVEGPAATTRMMCAGPQMELETKLYELLDGPLSYRLDHRTLTLVDGGGEGLTARAEPAR